MPNKASLVTVQWRRPPNTSIEDYALAVKRALAAAQVAGLTLRRDRGGLRGAGTEAQILAFWAGLGRGDSIEVKKP